MNTEKIVLSMICTAPQACIAHGLEMPCDLCDVEDQCDALCQVCGERTDGAVSPGQLRLCAGWRMQAPVLPWRRVLASSGQESLAAVTRDVESMATLWLDEIESTVGFVDRAAGVLRVSRSAFSKDYAGLHPSLHIRFSDQTAVHVIDVADALHIPVLGHQTTEIIFDDRMLRWKQSERSESAQPTCVRSIGAATSPVNIQRDQRWSRTWSSVVAVGISFDYFAAQASLEISPPVIVDFETHIPSAPVPESALPIERNLNKERDRGVSLGAYVEIRGSTVVVVGTLQFVDEVSAVMQKIVVEVYDSYGAVWNIGSVELAFEGRLQKFSISIPMVRMTAPARVFIFPF
jgi:hypothetical protein